MTILTKWEDCTIKYNNEFIKRFCKVTDVEMVVGVWWSSDSMRIDYLVSSGRTITDGFKMEEWLGWLGEVCPE